MNVDLGRKVTDEHGAYVRDFISIRAAQDRERVKRDREEGCLYLAIPDAYRCRDRCLNRDAFLEDLGEQTEAGDGAAGRKKAWLYRFPRQVRNEVLGAGLAFNQICTPVGSLGPRPRPAPGPLGCAVALQNQRRVT